VGTGWGKIAMSDEPQARPREIRSIQYLRAVAAVAVVGFHILQDRSWIFGLGLYGVDIFFVISGFIMIVLTDNSQITPGIFVLDRVSRIAPPYWLATILAYVMVRIGIPVYHAKIDTAYLIRSLLFIPGFNDFGKIMPTLHLGWTLNYEMFFYGIFAVVLFAPRYRVTMLSITFVILVGSGTVFKPQSAAGIVYTNPMLLEFLAGALLGKLFGRNLDHLSIVWQITGAMAISIALIALGENAPRLLIGGFAAFVVAAGLLLERHGLMPNIPWLRLLGNASFAIYMFQQCVFDIVGPAFDTAFTAVLHHRPPHLLTSGTNIVAAISFGIVMYRFGERPLTRGVRAVLGRMVGHPVKLVTRLT
jgi:exopolysaccharide production protein ExoZ